MSELKVENKEKFLDKLETEAIELLDNFKQHPIKSMATAMLMLWGI